MPLQILFLVLSHTPGRGAHLRGVMLVPYAVIKDQVLVLKFSNEPSLRCNRILMSVLCFLKPTGYARFDVFPKRAEFAA